MKKCRMFGAHICAALLWVLGCGVSVGAGVLENPKLDGVTPKIGVPVSIPFGKVVSADVDYTEAGGKYAYFIYRLPGVSTVTEFKYLELTNDGSGHFSGVLPVLDQGSYEFFFYKYPDDGSSLPPLGNPTSRIPAGAPKNEFYNLTVESCFSEPSVNGVIIGSETMVVKYGEDINIQVHSSANSEDVQNRLVYSYGGKSYSMNFDVVTGYGQCTLRDLPEGEVTFYFAAGREDGEEAARYPSAGGFTIRVDSPICDAKVNGVAASLSASYTNAFYNASVISVSNAINGVVTLHYSVNGGTEVQTQMSAGEAEGVYTAEIPAATGPGDIRYYFTAGAGSAATRLPVDTSERFVFSVATPLYGAQIDGEACGEGVVHTNRFIAPPSLSISSEGTNLVWVYFVDTNGKTGIYKLDRQEDGTYSCVLPMMSAGDVSYRFQTGRELGVPVASLPVSDGTYFKYHVLNPFSNPLINGEDAVIAQIETTIDNPPELSVVSEAPYDVFVNSKLLYEPERLAASGDGVFKGTISPLPSGVVEYWFETKADNGAFASSSVYTYSVKHPLSNARRDGVDASEPAEKAFGEDTSVSVDSSLPSEYLVWAVCIDGYGFTNRVRLASSGGATYSGVLPVVSEGDASLFFEVTDSADQVVYAVHPQGAAYSFTVASPLSDPTIDGEACDVSVVPGYNFDNPPTLGVSYSGAEGLSVWVDYSVNGAESGCVQMNDNGDGTYSYTMPFMPAGTVTYGFSVGMTLGAPMSTFSETYTYTVSDVLGDDRKPDHASWKEAFDKVASGGDFYYGQIRFDVDDSGGRWISSGGVYISANSTLLKPSAFVKYHGTMPIGSIWLLAKYRGSEEGGGTLRCALSSKSNTSAIYDEDVIDVNVKSTGNQWQLIRLKYNIEQPKSLMLQNFSGGAAEMEIAGIIVSAPAADVLMTKNPLDYHPGYPSRWDPVKFSINVESAFTNYPAAAISPKLVWRLNSGAWNESPMSRVGQTTEYTVELPALDPGRFEYFYRTDFEGYYYVYVVDDLEEIANADEFALWLGSGTTISESCNPAYLPDYPESQLYDIKNDRPEGYEYNMFEVRRFRSNYDTVTLNIAAADGTELNTEPSYSMDQVGDYVWQAIINTTNAINVGMNVLGTEPYLGPDSTDYEHTTILWQENDQETINPPMSGTAERNGADPIHVEIDYQGFLMFRFNAQTGLYEIRRAAWQDFNSWQASDYEYSRSFGLFETTTYATDLEGSSETLPTPSPMPYFEDFEADASSSSFEVGGLAVRLGSLITERVVSETSGGEEVFNKALLLNANTYAPGSVETTRSTGGNGRDTLTMRVRAGFDDDNLAYYRRGIAFENYTVTSEISVQSMSPGNPWVSVIGYYVDPENYIEGRIVQEAELGSSYKSKLTGYIIQHKSGVETVLATKAFSTSSGVPTQLTAAKWQAALSLESADDATIDAAFTVSYADINGAYQSCMELKDVTAVIDVNSAIIGGTVGVNSGDAIATFWPKVSAIGSGPSSGFGDVSSTTSSGSWYLGGRMEGDTRNRWAFSAPSGTVGCSLVRNMPVVPFRVMVYRTGLEDYYMAPGMDWSTSWDEFSDGDEVKTSSSLSYENISIPMHLWDNVFIKISPTGSDGYLVLDDLFVEGWRGLSPDYDPALPESDPDAETVWRAEYDVRTKRGDSVMYEFTLSRADPDAQQMIVSPLMEDGIGDIIFNYEVTGGNVAFRVERNTYDGVFDSWMEVAYTNVQPTASQQRMYTACLTNMVGRVRIVIDRENSSPQGTLWLDNIRVTDYPVVGDGSWAGYNVLISSLPNESDKKFDGAYNVDYKSAVLNNSYNEGTPSGIMYDEDKPYIQTPLINTGVGEVSFWYRSYTPRSRNPAKIELKVAPSSSTPSSEWKTLTKEDLNKESELYEEQVAALESLNCITNEQWVYFSIEIYDTDNGVLRLYSDVEDASRPMVDNVLITEPVRTSIEIGEVSFVPDIPLYTGPVGVRVRLKNPRMNPRDIVTFFDYTTSTNVWGYENWDQDGVAGRRRVQLAQDPDDELLYTADNVIPQLPADSVVQYNVEVNYSGTFPAPVHYGEQFVNPEWYEPVDLNELYGSETGDRSAYFFVFTVPTNVVFINEFYPSYDTPQTLQEYVELMGPRNGNISGWTLEHFRYADIGADSVIPFYVNKLKQGAAFSADKSYQPGGDNEGEDDKGWGFYVLGRSETSDLASDVRIDEELFPEDEDYYLDGGSSGSAGAMNLKRSMGAYVDRISWGSYAYRFDPFGFMDIGVTRPTSATGRRRVFALTEDGDGAGYGWNTDPDYTPGMFNYGQISWLDPVSPLDPVEPSDTPSIEVRITGIKMTEKGADVTFAVTSTNGVELGPNSGWTWSVCASSSIGFAEEQEIPITEDITASSDGTPSEYTVSVEFASPEAAGEFYRIKAVPTL